MHVAVPSVAWRQPRSPSHDPGCWAGQASPSPLRARQTEPSQYAVQVQVALLTHDPPTGTRGVQVLVVGAQTSDKLAQAGGDEVGKLLPRSHEAPVGAG
jgi:hypothetical protein